MTVTVTVRVTVTYPRFPYPQNKDTENKDAENKDTNNISINSTSFININITVPERAAPVLTDFDRFSVLEVMR